MSEFVMRSCTSHDQELRNVVMSRISREPGRGGLRDNWQQQSLKSFCAPSVAAVSAAVSCETASLPANVSGPSFFSDGAHTDSVPGVVDEEMTDPIYEIDYPDDASDGTVEASCHSCADLLGGNAVPPVERDALTSETVETISQSRADLVVEGVAPRPVGRNDLSGETAEVTSHSRVDSVIGDDALRLVAGDDLLGEAGGTLALSGTDFVFRNDSPQKSGTNGGNPASLNVALQPRILRESVFIELE